MKKIYFLFLLFGISVTALQAQLLVEDFNYTAGDQLTTKGWTAHSGGTTNPVLVTSPGLTFTGYVGSNLGLAAGINNDGQDVNKQYAVPTSGTVYTSFLVNATASSTGSSSIEFFHFYDPAQSTARRCKTAIKSKTGKMMVALSFNSNALQDSMSTLLNFGETYLFVAKYKIVDGALNDDVSLYVFKAGDDFTNEPAKPTLGPLTATRTTPTDPLSPLAPDIVPTGIALRQFDAGQKITVDGFRVKTKWDLKKDDVTFVSNSKYDEIKAYPNPVTNGVIYILTSDNSEKQIEIFDIVGRKIMSEIISTNQINVSKLKSGVYILKTNANGESLASKIIIE